MQMNELHISGNVNLKPDGATYNSVLDACQYTKGTDDDRKRAQYKNVSSCFRSKCSTQWRYSLEEAGIHANRGSIQVNTTIVNISIVL